MNEVGRGVVDVDMDVVVVKSWIGESGTGNKSLTN
jgi:hypothetical protein